MRPAPSNSHPGRSSSNQVSRCSRHRDIVADRIRVVTEEAVAHNRPAVRRQNRRKNCRIDPEGTDPMGTGPGPKDTARTRRISPG